MSLHKDAHILDTVEGTYSPTPCMMRTVNRKNLTVLRMACFGQRFLHRTKNFQFFSIVNNNEKEAAAKKVQMGTRN